MSAPSPDARAPLPPGTLEFWYELASTYSYPAAMRIERLAEAAGVSVVWRPFLLGPIFRSHGLEDSPFNLNPVKGRYMWRDLERICRAEGLPFRRPSHFPRNSLLAARVVHLGCGEGWGPAVTRALYQAEFAEDRDIGEREVVAEVLRSSGLDPGDVLERALAPENKAALRRQTDTAMELGLFGAPSFRAGGELFWGNDRLEVALEWCRRASPSPSG